MQFNETHEEILIRYISKMTLEPHFLSDPKIADKISSEFNLVIEVSNVGLMRKRHGIRGGVQNKDERSNKLAAEEWNKSRCLKKVSIAAGISTFSSKTKIMSLHAKGIVSAPELVKSGKPVNLKRKKKNEIKPETVKLKRHITDISKDNLHMMKQRKFDRVKELQQPV